MKTVKYFAEWRDFKGVPMRVEFLTEGTNTPIEVTLRAFRIEHPVVGIIDPKESKLVGAGAHIELISTDKLFFKDLYAIAPTDILIKHYVNGALNFLGWVDTEQYDDPIAEELNYVFRVSANNGAVLLSRFYITDFNGTILNGVYSLWDVLRYCLSKTQLPFSKIYVGLNTQIENQTISSSETLLHRLYAKSDNYVDETGTSTLCRAVIDSILQPLTCVCFFITDCVYILDMTELNKNTLNFKIFNYDTGAYETTTAISNLTILNTLLRRSEEVGYRSGGNAIDIRFSKFAYSNPIKIPVDTPDPATLQSTIVYDVTKNKQLYKYEEKVYTAHPKITPLHSGTVFVKQEEMINNFTVDNFIRFNPITARDQQVGAFRINTGIHLNSSRYLFRFRAQLMIEKMSKYEVEVIDKTTVTQTQANDSIYSYGLFVKIGPYSAYGFSEIDNEGWWRDLETPYPYNTAQFFKLNKQAILNTDVPYDLLHWVSCNKWFDINQYSTPLFPMNSDAASAAQNKAYSCRGGELVIEFRLKSELYNDNITNFTYRLKDIQITLEEYNAYGTARQINQDDIVVMADTGQAFIDKIEVETTHGTDPEGLSRAGFLVQVTGLYNDSDYATNTRLANAGNFIRNGKTGTLEDLMCNTYLSNYQVQRYQLHSCVVSGYKSILETHNYALLKRNSTNVRLMTHSCTHDYVLSETLFNCVEIVNETL